MDTAQIYGTLVGKWGYEKIFNTVISLACCEENNKISHPTKLLYWLQFKIVIQPNVSTIVEQSEMSFTADGYAKWYEHFGRYFDSS